MILVDDVRRYRSGWWCHMVSDRSVEELHAFASEIGLRRRWFQGGPRPHYDLRPSRRRVAVSKGAEEVGARELVKRMARG
ncbi:MAG: DUF4031 domain-containing protein [Actinomycetota bacterium]|nr:DUF4031 domain-containing protein [Actinomycetota bacterium]